MFHSYPYPLIHQLQPFYFCKRSLTLALRIATSFRDSQHRAITKPAMDVISRSTTMSSNLNPNAPMFVPVAYRTVEDLSDGCWALVQSSPWFQDYWLQERFQDPQNDPSLSDIHDPALLPDVNALFDDVENIHHSPNTQAAEEEEKDLNKELISLGLLKWRKGRPVAEAPRYIEKAPKIVNVKVSPRAIQQPRWTEPGGAG